MKELLVLSLILVCMYGIGFIKLSNIKMEWMDKNYTNALKGFSIFTVIWAHGGGQLGIRGIQFVAGVGVSLFLILSGYGLEQSYIKNGLKGFWLKRIIKLSLPLLIINLLRIMPLKMIGIDRFWPEIYERLISDWYLGYIVICYAVFYLTKVIVVKLMKQKSNIECIVLFIIFTIFFVYECIKPLNAEMPFLRARQIYAFLIGVVIAKRNEMTFYRKYIKNTNFIAGIILFISVACMAISSLTVNKGNNYFLINIISLLTVVFMALAILLITYKYIWLVRNRILMLSGIISYEMYIMQKYALSYLANSWSRLIIYLSSIFGVAIITALIVKVINMLMKKSISIITKE